VNLSTGMKSGRRALGPSLWNACVCILISDTHTSDWETMRMNIYVPDDLAEQVKQIGDINVSAVCQAALREEVARLGQLPKPPVDLRRIKVTLELDHADFERLSVDRMEWHGLGWHDMPGRFRNVQDGDIDWGYRRAYWYADAQSMILARSYLHTNSEAHQVLTDESDDGGSPYMIVTNYSQQAGD
jgi:hypothetical protein